MNKIIVSKVNESFNKIYSSDAGILYELTEYFTYMSPNAYFDKRYKNKVWDGKIRLFKPFTKLLYSGLNNRLELFAKSRQYEVEYDSNQNSQTEFSIKEAFQFIKTLNLPKELIPYEVQVEAFVKTIRRRRITLLSPTSSGKSLIIYLIIMYLILSNKKVLLVVPSIQLVKQMFSDFASYGCDVEAFCHYIHGGREKNSDKLITISTWQSIYEQDEEYFKIFDCTIVDECHGANVNAKSLINLMSKCINSSYRIGLTATIGDEEVNKITIEGLFGPIHIVTTLKEMEERGRRAKLNIKLLILKHNEEERQKLKGIDYHKEINYLKSNNNRNNFIKNLAFSLNNNVLILFEHVGTHGEILYQLLKNSTTDKEVYIIHGNIDVDDREYIRTLCETKNNLVVIASFKTFSQGINIKNLHHGILAHSTKGSIRLLQSIGRGLRKLGDDKVFTWYDISDDLSWKKWHNTTLNHLKKRIEIYNKEELTYKIYNIGLK